MLVCCCVLRNGELIDLTCPGMVLAAGGPGSILGRRATPMLSGLNAGDSAEDGILRLGLGFTFVVGRALVA